MICVSLHSAEKAAASHTHSEYLTKYSRAGDISTYLSAAGWYRIYHLHAAGNLNAGPGMFRVVVGSIYNNWNNACVAVDIAFSYQQAKIVQAVYSGNGFPFSAMRLVPDGTYGAGFYLDVYYTPGNSNNVFATITPFLGSADYCDFTAQAASSSITVTTTLALIYNNYQTEMGTATITYYASANGAVSVNFYKTFTSKPTVTVSQVFNEANIVVMEEDISATGFTARIGPVGSSGTRTFRWVATGF